jgi:flavin-dependent dehydrogenase
MAASSRSEDISEESSGNGGKIHETDVAIIGGALAGSASALLIRRENPEIRVTLIEKSGKFDRKVGEATTEVSGEFFHRRLGLARHLTHEHLAKQSLRMWFTRGPETPFDDTVEIGAKYQSKYPAYQLDRSIFDQHLLETACAEGAEVMRPAEILDAEVGGTRQTLRVRNREGDCEVRARWVLDASGPSTFLARRLGLRRKLDAHPTAALWARFHGVKDWDDHAVRSRFPRYGSTGLTCRAAATNHLVGPGWWCWLIPLRGGDFSAGLVFDTRIFTPPPGPSPGARLKAHILNHPVGREFFADAEPVDGDVRARGRLPYYSEKLAGPGWQMVGDAAGFIDPLYSPGMDYCSWTSRMAAARVCAEFRGEYVDLNRMNADFLESYHTWFEALYKDKYFHIGDAELMSTAYLLDIGLFFLGPGFHSIREKGGDDLWCLPFIGPVDRVVGRMMRFYNRRLATIARRRMEAGCYGRRNTGWQELYTDIGPTPGVAKILIKALARWAHAEIHAATLPSPGRLSDLQTQGNILL